MQADSANILKLHNFQCKPNAGFNTKFGLLFLGLCATIEMVSRKIF
jgi:hypothetical protein